MISLSVGLLSGVTVYLLISYLFEDPIKTVNDSPGVDQDPPDVVEDEDYTIPLEKVVSSD